MHFKVIFPLFPIFDGQNQIAVLILNSDPKILTFIESLLYKVSESVFSTP